MKNFALIGAGGYVAPRHMEAIQKTGNRLVAAMDIHDSVGVLDNFFPTAAFFTEFERFDRHIDQLRRKGEGVNYLSVCTPNYLHDAHCRFGLRSDADVICEKPLVLNPWNVEALSEMEKETGRQIFTILQLRLHPEILALRQRIDSNKEKKYNVSLRYIAARGDWYHYSWKGDEARSGGIISNIGVHIFDMLLWVFGPCSSFEINQRTAKTVSGKLDLQNALVSWTLSIDEAILPEAVRSKGIRTYRSMTVDEAAVDFSDGFENLHIKSYEEILAGRGFTVGNNLAVTELMYKMRNGDKA